VKKVLKKTKTKQNALAHHPDGEKKMIANSFYFYGLKQGSTVIPHPKN
jgi:hypothetical protein